MPLNFLFGAAILGGAAFNNAVNNAVLKEYEEERKKKDEEERQAEIKKYAPIPQEMRDIFHGYYKQYRYGPNATEIPNAFVQGGQLYYVDEARTVDDTIAAARANRPSYVNPQPRWRIAKLSDFKRYLGDEMGICYMAYMLTRFHYMSDNMEATDEQWDLLKQAVRRYYLVYYTKGIGGRYSL